MNVYANDWDDPFPPIEGWRQHVKRLLPRSPLGMTVYELEAGQTQCPYHLHHGEEELIVVLRGKPTLRTPTGERELDEGDVVHFPKGADGLHQIINRSATRVRYIVASTNATPEVCEYPDSGKVGIFSRESSTRGGEMLATMHRFDDAVAYLEGERPRE